LEVCDPTILAYADHLQYIEEVAAAGQPENLGALLQVMYFDS